MSNVIAIGWSTVSTEAIRAACTIAGHEPESTRQRREPIAIAPIDYRAEYPASSIGGKRGPKAKDVTVLADIRAARQRERDDAEGISNRPSGVQLTGGARDKREHQTIDASSSSESVRDSAQSHALQNCTHPHIPASKAR